MPDRTQAPPIVDAADLTLTLQPLEKFTLKNGVDVYSINAGPEEVLAIEWVFFAGNWYEEQNLVAASANYLLKNGTGKRTAFEINEHFDYYGSYLNRTSSHETANISLHSLTKHVHELLPAIREIITDSTMPEEEIAIYKQNMKQRLKVNLKKSDFVGNRLIDTYLYGSNHPYGKFTAAADFDAVCRDQLMDFYKKYYQQGKFIIFAAGKLPDNFEELLNNHFGDLPNTTNAAVAHATVPSSQKKHRIANDENGIQGSIRIAREFPGRHHPDFQKSLVLNTLFGGFFGSRLMANIREEKGYTYGIHSYIQNHQHETAWMISTEAGKDVSEATIAEVYNEMELLRDDLVDDEELSLVKNYMIGSILGDLDGPFQIIARWKNIILNGYTERYFYDSIRTIKTVSAEELQELAKKYLVPEDFYELIVT